MFQKIILCEKDRILVYILNKKSSPLKVRIHCDRAPQVFCFIPEFKTINFYSGIFLEI